MPHSYRHPNAVITRLSPAKINLFLHITGKRDDGYHNLQTVFRLLDWGDYLHFSPKDPLDVGGFLAITAASEQQITALCQKLVTLTGADTITEDVTDNLIFKAAKALLMQAQAAGRLPHHLQRVSIAIDKHLPMGAGLGGGSSNAATTLMSLNEVWQLGFDQAALIKIGATLGADVPIFIFGQDAIAGGIGEQLCAIDLPDQAYLILTPDAHVNTAHLFAHPNLRRDIAPVAIETIKRQTEDYIQRLRAPYHNVFTPIVTSLAPAIDEALSYLQDLEAQALGTARMTGSGSAVFLPIDEQIATDHALLAKWVIQSPCPAYITHNL